MILEVLSIIILFISIGGWGIWAQYLLASKKQSPSLTFLLGLTFLSIVLCIILFFYPLNRKIEILLFAISIIPYFIKNLKYYRIKFPLEIIKSGWFWLFSLLILLVGSYYPFRPDHFGYYIPSLNWLNQYGLILGVANIDWVLGQMSSLHIIQAGFDDTIDPFQRINLLITILFIFYIFERKVYFLLLFIPFYFLFIQTPSPDIPVIFFSLIIVNEECFNYKKENFKVIFILSVFIFTIKPFGFWLPLWIFLMGTHQNKKELLNYKNYIFPLILILTFVIKNIVTSSTIIFPVTQTQITTYWLTDPRILKISNQYANYYTFNGHFPIEKINSFSFFKKLYYWLSIRELQTIINIFICITLFIFGIFAFIKKKFIYISLWSIIFLKLYIILLFSGQYRFILDGIYPLIFILFHYKKINQSKILAPALALNIIFFTLISYPVLIQKLIPEYKLANTMVGFTKGNLLKPKNYILNDYKKVKLGNLILYITNNNSMYNFDTPAPAFEKEKLILYKNLNIFPQMKDSTDIHKGFYMKKLTKQENNKLTKIIESFKNN